MIKYVINYILKIKCIYFISKIYKTTFDFTHINYTHSYVCKNI